MVEGEWLMADGNYIKLDRSILDWEWYGNINTCRLFIHMLLKANWKDGRFEGMEIPRGSFVSSIKGLAKETNMTTDEVRTAIKHLEDTESITKQSTNKFTIFTVANYCDYQNQSQAITNQVPSNSQTIPKLFPTIEERKKERKEEGNIYIQVVDLYNAICISFPKVKTVSASREKALKARLKQYAVDDFKKLFEMAESSCFMKGGNDRNWTADFDWMIKDANMPKILEGKYKDKQPETVKPKQHAFNSFPQRNYSKEDYSSMEAKALAKQRGDSNV